MENELISVIIPVYKVEPYLEKCVQSVLAQTYPRLEVILVDDGSPDGCPAICDKLAAENSCLRVIHQPNSGLSAARNAGIDVALGEYIGFVDSDDYIAPDMMEKLYTALCESGADMSICGIQTVDPSGHVLRPLPALPSAVMSPEEIFQCIERPGGDWRCVTSVNRLYRIKLFDGLRFPVGKLYEDEFLTPLVLVRCASIAVIPNELYFYVQRVGSIMNTMITIQRLDAVEAFMMRYDLHRKRSMASLASAALHTAYQYLWEVITSLHVWEYRDNIRPWVRRVATAQARELNYSAVVLTLRYVWELMKCRVFGRKEAKSL